MQCRTEKRGESFAFSHAADWVQPEGNDVLLIDYLETKPRTPPPPSILFLLSSLTLFFFPSFFTV
jgi:hypothetical protein